MARGFMIGLCSDLSMVCAVTKTLAMKTLGWKVLRSMFSNGIIVIYLAQ